MYNDIIKEFLAVHRVVEGQDSRIREESKVSVTVYLKGTEKYQTFDAKLFAFDIIEIYLQSPNSAPNEETLKHYKRQVDFLEGIIKAEKAVAEVGFFVV